MRPRFRGPEKPGGGAEVFHVVEDSVLQPCEDAGSRPCALTAPHLGPPNVRTREALQAPSSSLRGAPLAQARLAQSPLGFIRLQPAPSESGFPFSWTRFLTWALRRGSARHAPGPGSRRRSWVARAPRTLETLETWPWALSVKSTTSARVRLTLFFCYRRSRRRRSLQGREEPELGASEPCGAKR